MKKKRDMTRSWEERGGGRGEGERRGRGGKGRGGEGRGGEGGGEGGRENSNRTNTCNSCIRRMQLLLSMDVYP